MQRGTVKSASRTIQVLELFQQKKRPLRLNEIYRELNYPQSSATNLLKSLVVAGYLNYNRSTMSYLPTLKVSSLGSWLSTTLNSYGELDRLIQDIHSRTGETVGLVSQNDLFIQYVRFVSNADAPYSRLQELNMPPDEGTMRLMVDSSAGLAMLSRLRDREIDKIYRYSRHYNRDSDAVPDFEEFMREVRWARQVGYAFLPKKPTPELASIAIALDQRVHGIPLAVGVGGLVESISKRKNDILRVMREAIASFHSTQLLAQAGEGDLQYAQAS